MNRTEMIQRLEEIIQLLDNNYMDNNFDCYGCCGCCSKYDDLQESVQIQLKEIVDEMKGTKEMTKALFDLQDCKTGEYTTEMFETLNAQLIVADENKMLSLDDLKKIKEVYMEMVGRHIGYVMKKLPFNARIEYTMECTEDMVRLLYKDDNLEMPITIQAFNDGTFSLDCTRFKSLQVKDGNYLNIEDLQCVRKAIEEACNKVLEGLKIS